MKFLSKLTAIGLAFSLAAGLAGCQSSNAETTSSAADTTSAAASSESIPDLEVTIPLDDVTLPETTAAPAESENASESTAGGESTTAANGEVDLSKVVALTFDDGPDTKDTSSSNRILDVLEQYGCKAYPLRTGTGGTRLAARTQQGNRQERSGSRHGDRNTHLFTC